jgi:hypothetical protein
MIFACLCFLPCPHLRKAGEFGGLVYSSASMASSAVFRVTTFPHDGVFPRHMDPVGRPSQSPGRPTLDPAGRQGHGPAPPGVRSHG